MPNLRCPLRPVLTTALPAAPVAAGCTPRLSQRHEFFSPLDGVAGKIAADTDMFAVRGSALQEVQHACASPALAMAVICPERARFPAAYGASLNVYRRWAADGVRELPPPSATAASAGGS